MSRLIFVNRYFFPDHSATSQILSDLTFHLAGMGRNVHVITGTQIYDNPKASLPAHEIINDVHVHRVSSTSFGRTGLIGRALDYLSFYWSSYHCIMKIVRPGDMVIAKTDPPLISVVAMAATRRRRAHLVNWLQDIYPETAVELGVPLMRGPIGRILEAQRNRSLRSALATVGVGELMGQKAEALGAAAATTHVIPNWCNDEDITPVGHADNPLRYGWELADKFVLGYSGNLGRAHEFDTVLAAAERLRQDPRIVFLMIGGGKQFEELNRRVVERGLSGSFRFAPYQERVMLRFSLGVADAHWLSLNPRLEGLIVPSKFYGIAAAGRPMIVIGDENGELGRLVEKERCGYAIPPGDSKALVALLHRLAGESDALAEMGKRARNMLDAQFTRQQGLARWCRLLDRLDRASVGGG